MNSVWLKIILNEIQNTPKTGLLTFKLKLSAFKTDLTCVFAAAQDGAEIANKAYRYKTEAFRNEGSKSRLTCVPNTTYWLTLQLMS